MIYRQDIAAGLNLLESVLYGVFIWMMKVIDHISLAKRLVTSIALLHV